MKKYKKGRQITEINDFLNSLNEDNFIYYRHKIYHYGWVISWQLITIHRYLRAKQIWKAEKRNKDENYSV
jgi:hypothetical protein